MSEAVFWDSVAYIALGNRSDALHGAAITLSRQLAAARAPIVTTDAVLTEVLSAFSRVAWRPLAVRIIDAVGASVADGTATVVHIDTELWDQAVQLFRDRPDKSWGLTDCTSFTVMENRGLHRAFTSDRHFEQAGYIRLLTPDEGR